MHLRIDKVIRPSSFKEGSTVGCVIPLNWLKTKHVQHTWKRASSSHPVICWRHPEVVYLGWEERANSSVNSSAKCAAAHHNKREGPTPHTCKLHQAAIQHSERKLQHSKRSVEHRAQAASGRPCWTSTHSNGPLDLMSNLT